MNAYMLLWAALVCIIPIAFVAALIQVWNHRERKDGKR